MVTLARSVISVMSRPSSMRLGDADHLSTTAPRQLLILRIVESEISHYLQTTALLSHTHHDVIVLVVIINSPIVNPIKKANNT